MRSKKLTLFHFGASLISIHFRFNSRTFFLSKKKSSKTHHSPLFHFCFSKICKVVTACAYFGGSNSNSIRAFLMRNMMSYCRWHELFCKNNNTLHAVSQVGYFLFFFYRLCNLPISGIVNGSFLILLIIGPKIFEGMSSLNGVVLHIYLVSKILHCQLLEYNFNEQIKFTHFEKSWWVHSLNSSYSSGRGVKNLSIVCSMSRYMLWPTTSLPYNFLNITYNL